MHVDRLALADEVEALALEDFFGAATPALRSQLGLRVERHGGAVVLLAPGLSVALFNRVIGAGVHRPANPDDVDHWLRTLALSGATPRWVHLSPQASPPALSEWLRARGLTEAKRRAWVKLWRDAAPPPGWRTDLSVVPAVDESLAATVRAIVSAFEMPDILAEWIGCLHGRPGWRIYSLCEGNTPVGGAALFVSNRCAWLGMAGVLPSHRRRGGQGALLIRRITDAIEAGCESLFTETGEPVGAESNPSLDNMLRVGFTPLMSRLNLLVP